MRRLWLAAWLVTACATPDKLPTGACGNGVVDPGEDCEYFPGLDAGPGTTCAQPGSAHECHFVCDPGDTATAQCPTGFACAMDGACASVSNTCGNGVIEQGEDCEPTLDNHGATCAPPGAANACHYTCGSATCPASYGCGVDSRCRQPTGDFVEAKGSPFVGQDEFVGVADFNGDHVLDVVTGNTFNGAQISYGAAAHDGTFPVTTPFPVQYDGQLGVGDFDGDGRADLAMDGLPGLDDHARRARRHAGLGDVADVLPADGQRHGRSGLRDPDARRRGLAVRRDLAVSVVSNHVLLAFDQFNSLTQQLAPDPTPITIAGAHTPFFTLFSSFAMPQQFPVADVNKTPATGGDEIAIAFLDEAVVRIFTATFTAGPGTGLPATLTAEHTSPAGRGRCSRHPSSSTSTATASSNVASIVKDSTPRAGRRGLAAPGVLGRQRPWHHAAPVVQRSSTRSSGSARPIPGHRARQPRGRRARRRGVVRDQQASRRPAAPARRLALAGFLADGCVFIDECEVVAPDLNRDGFRDVAMTSQDGLGSATAVHRVSSTTRSSSHRGRRSTSAMGDFDGDRVDDVMFTIADAVTGETSLVRAVRHDLGRASRAGEDRHVAEPPRRRAGRVRLDQIPSSFDTTSDVVTVSAEGSATASPAPSRRPCCSATRADRCCRSSGIVSREAPAVVPRPLRGRRHDRLGADCRSRAPTASARCSRVRGVDVPVDGKRPGGERHRDRCVRRLVDVRRHGLRRVRARRRRRRRRRRRDRRPGLRRRVASHRAVRGVAVAISTIATEVTATPVALPVGQVGVQRSRWSMSTATATSTSSRCSAATRRRAAPRSRAPTTAAVSSYSSATAPAASRPRRRCRRSPRPARRSTRSRSIPTPTPSSSSRSRTRPGS